MGEGQRIAVFSAFTTAPTGLAAFDRALQQGGAHDANLLTLSSVIPPGATIIRDKVQPGSFDIGDRLYCVMAQERATEPGAEAWAGIGWATDQTGNGGLFVEAHGNSERQVRFELDESLEALISDRTYLRFGRRDYEVAGGMCEDEPVCALAMAVFGAEKWPHSR